MISGPSTPMPNKFSVVIPAKNAAGTLHACLHAVFSSDSKPYEVTVVADDSTDQTAAIAAKFPCRVLPVSISKGPMQPRFAGASQSISPYLIFVDADVCVRPETFSKILKHFENPETAAVTGILASASPEENFFTGYKNEYMNFVFSRQPAKSDFLYGSLWAIRKELLTEFEPVSEPFGSLVSDSELGMRLAATGHELILDHELEVVHLKKYSFSKLLKNDFVIPFMFAQIFAQCAKPGNLFKRKGFSHARAGQVFMTGVSFLGIFLFFFDPVPALFCFGAVWSYWLPFLEKILRKRSFGFVLKTVYFLPLDQAVMFAGMLSGFIYAFFKPLGSLVSFRKTAPLS